MSDSIREMKLMADGITCTSCASDMEGILTEIPGIVDVSVSFADDSVVIKYDTVVISRKDVYAAVRKLGFPLKIVSET
ncbi:MAG: heavy-metal-associated domain-containing protein [Nitrospirae bacterium]|nr:heavy-metal-associated domain-containing protein [Nitrospirota bacterium]